MRWFRFVSLLLLTVAFLASTSCATKDTTPLSEPANLVKTTADNDNTPTFSWEPVTDDHSSIAGYSVRLDGGEWIDIGDVTTYTCEDSIIDGGHIFEVKAGDEAGEESAAATLTFAVDTRPPIILAVTASEITETSATITWTTDEPATSQVEYGLTAAYDSATTLDEKLVTSHSATISGLSPNTTYHYRVKSSDAFEQSNMSEGCTFTTAKSTVEVSGVISENTTWTSDYIYVATGNVGVEEGATLTIEPGTVVRFRPACALQVKGILRAEGQMDNKIVFTAASEQCEGGNSACAWSGIQVVYSPSLPFRDMTISHCVIERANVGLDMGGYSSGSEITYNIIRDCSQGIVWMLAVGTVGGSIRHNEIYSNAIGIYASVSPADISHNVIRNNEVGLWVGGTVLLSHNTVRDNGTGIEGRGDITLQSNNIYSNQTFNLVYSYGTQPLDATLTWWGTTDESVIQQYIRDYYDDVTLQKVIYDPYATAPIPDAP